MMPMRVVFALGVVGLLSLVVAPVWAEEVHSLDYVGAAGVQVLGDGTGLAFSDHGIAGGTVYASGFYPAAAVTVDDRLWGANAAMATCAHDSRVDSLCEWVEGCGARVHHPYATGYADYVVAVMYGVLVTEDLDLCSASSGTVTVTFTEAA